MFYEIQGNILAGECVVPAIEQAVLETDGDIAEKLMAGMRAARGQGGDGRCSCSQSNATGCGCPPPGFSKSGHIGGIIVARIGDSDDPLCNAAGCADGEDSAFRKDPRMMRPVETPPFYAAQVAPFVVALTGCGLRIDADARVLDELDGPIEGLYAAGEATGSWIGEIYVASGNSIANSIVFGRIAGTNAAAYAALQEA